MGSKIRDFTVREELSLGDLAKREGGCATAAIDLYPWMYAFLYKIRGSDGEPLSDSEGRVTSHLSGLYFRTMNLLKEDIRPVFVLEGGYPELKSEEIERRQESKDKAQREYEVARKAGNQERMAQLEIDRRGISEEMQTTAFELFDAMGCPSFVPPEEAEPQCARMCSNGIVDYVISPDYDTLLYGSPNVVQELDSTNGEYVPLQESLEAHDLTHQELLWIGLMVGTDFNESPHGVGPKTAKKYAKKAKNIGEVIELCKEKDSSIEGERWRSTYELFAQPNVDLESDFGGWDLPDREKLREILVEKHEFRESRVMSTLNDVATEPEQSAFSEF